MEMSLNLIICAGIHPLTWTDDFVANLNHSEINLKPENLLIFPTDLFRAYDGQKIFQFIQESYPQPNFSPPFIIIGFSAGVVGALIASRLWQRHGGKVLALIALDGWGVPLIADFPIFTLCHDYFTHLTLIKFNSQVDSFYAEPSVSHEHIWRSPLQTIGWWQKPDGTKQKTNAMTIIKSCLEKYQ